MSKAKSQTIGCKVTSCAYNMSGCDCELERIEVEPMCGCHTGNPADESLCGSYKCRDRQQGAGSRLFHAARYYADFRTAREALSLDVRQCTFPCCH